MNWYKKTIIAGLPVYNSREFLKKLENEFGVQFIRHGKGDDQVWGIPGTNRQTVIPVAAGSKQINPFTMTKILRNLGIPLKDFKKKEYKSTDQTVKQPAQPSQFESEDIPEWKKQKWYQEQYANV